MERLRRADLRAIVRCVREFSALADLDTLSHRVLASLRRLVPADYVTYNEIDRPRRPGRLVKNQRGEQVCGWTTLMARKR